MKVLVIGGGGREHAIAWKISESSKVCKVYCAPGNGGTLLENKCENININTIDELLKFAKQNEIDYTIVGPEGPLVEGIVDKFKEQGFKIFGPSKGGAVLEGSKIFAKEFMKKYGVKTPEYQVFCDYEKALEYIRRCSYPVVIKADGLAAGKGVVICQCVDEAKIVLEDFMLKDVFQGSGKKIVIEEFLEGVEASILSITDGKTIIPFISSKDHKQALDGNEGPNTGGMGAIAPNPYCTEQVVQDFEENILNKTLKGIQQENMDYIGIIFFGIMITKKGAYLLEYNVRMGDPETQAVLVLMKSDFVDLIDAAIKGNLNKYKIEWKNEFSCCVVQASGGYPGSYKKGIEIIIPETLQSKVFIAGATMKGNVLKTTGGRVLCVVSKADTLEQAREKAYENVEKISFKGAYYRKDIGKVL